MSDHLIRVIRQNNYGGLRDRVDNTTCLSVTLSSRLATRPSATTCDGARLASASVATGSGDN